MNPTKLLSSVLAFAIGITPMAASADQYMFRYRQPVSALPVPPVEDVEYGIGNDIVAYFVAPAGYDFAKRIPVATQDVVEWRRDSGEIPSGILLDVATGMLSGKPAQAEQKTTLWHGYDAGGSRIARAEMHFTVFEPVGVPSVVDFYAHTGTYFYGEIPNPEGVEVHTWAPVDGMVYPDGMSMMNSAFQGTPTAAGQTDLAWRGFDYLGREVAFAYGDILVADGPLVEEIVADGFRTQFGDQTKDKSKGESFNVAATVREALGPVTYKLVPDAARPAGLWFSSSSGILSNVYDDFDISATFRIEARDSYDGTTALSTPFTLTTLPAVADLSSLDGAVFRGTVGIDFHRQFSAANVLSGAKWEIISGVLPDGLVFDEDKGLITGKPLKTETQGDIRIRVSGPGMTTVEGGPFTIRIQSEAIEATTTPLEVRINTPFATDGMNVSGGVSQGYTVTTSSTLSAGLSLDADTGVITAASGVDSVGYHNAYLRAENAAGDRWAYAWQSIAAYNPLDVAYEDMTVERRKTKRQIPEVLPWTVIGQAKYSIDPAPPAWMSFNPRNGRIDLNPVEESTEGTHGPFEVTISDSTKETKTSKPFTITVEKRPELETVVNDRDVQRYVGNGYRLASARNAFDSISFAMTGVPANWPSTLRLTADGWLVGTTTDPVGTVYPGIVVTATDGEGATDPSEPFDLTVLEPTGLGGLYGPLNKTVTWTKDKTFSDVLPPLRNGYGKITYTFDPPIPGVDLTDPSTGAFSGTIPAAGKTTHSFTVEDETDRPAATGTLTLDIREPLDASAQGDVTLNRAAYFQPQTVPAFTGGAEPFTYSLQGTLPEGMTYLNGKLYGTPKEEGDFPVTVTVTDKTGEQTTASFTLKVGAPLPFEISFPAGDLYVGESAPYGVLKAPTLRNALSGTGFSWGQPQGTLPPGVGFSNGSFTGTPTEAGRYTVTVDATDGEGRPASATVELVVTLRGTPKFEPQTFRIRSGSGFTKQVDVSNAIAPLTFTSSDAAGMPHGLILNPSSGSITGQFDTAGSYTAGVMVEDDMGRKSSTMVTFEVVGDLAISTSDATLKQYEAAQDTPAVTAENAVGPMTYALVSGTLPAGVDVDPATGAIIGTSDDFGTWAGLVIEGTDEDGTKVRTGEFTLTVEQRPPLALEAPAALPLKRFSMARFTAQAQDAIPPVRFEVTPDLPAGLDLDADNGSITGSSDEIVPETVYTLKAIDSKGGELGTDIASFTLKVEERDRLDISVADIPAKRYSDLAPVTVKVAAGTAVGAMTYEISPTLPEGLSFADGVISGRPTNVLDATVYTVSAVDSKGGELGSDETTFTLSIADRDPLGIDGPGSFEFPQYFEGEVGYTPVAAIEGASFSISPVLPEGLELDSSTGVISGTASEKMAATQYTLTVEDAYDTFDRTITLSVGDRTPMEFVTPADQKVVLNGDFTLTLEAANVVGDEVTWEHVSGDLPAGIDFDAATGTFSGSATEFGVTSNVTIRATDAFGGEANRTFVFTVIQDGTPITLTAAGGKTRMGHAFDIAAPTAENLVGDFWYAAVGLEGTGLAVNRKTGQLEGKAAYAFEKDVTVTLEDVTGRKAEKTVKLVSAPAMTVAAQAAVALTYNKEPDAEKVTAPVAVNADGAVTWTHTGTLPSGLSVDPSTGMFTGKPKQLGTFGPIALIAADSLPGTASSKAVTITVTMNEDPIELAVQPFTTKIGYTIDTAVPVYDNHLGAVTFFSTDLPSGIRLDPKTGVLSGTATELLDRNVNISVRDTDTLRVTSRPLHLKVIPLMQITVPQQVPVLALTNIAPISPNRQYVVGDATWEELDQIVNKLPEGIVFDTTTGSFRGNAKELGEFGPFTVASTDSLGDRGVSNSFMIRVTPGTHFVALAAADLPDGVKRIEEYSYDLTQHLTNVGMDVSELTWTLGAGSPPGLTLDNGTLSGTPSLSGEYTFDVTVSYGSVSATRSYTVKIELPEIDLQLADGTLPAAKRKASNADNSYTHDLKDALTLKNIEKEDVTFTLEPFVDGESFPAGLVVGADGTISGTATAEAGTYSFRVKTKFTDATDEDISAISALTIEVTESITFSFGDKVLAGAEKRVPFNFDLGELIDDQSLQGVTKPELSWSWQLDPDRDPLATRPELPRGLLVSGTSITGTPVNSGRYDLILKATFDGREITRKATFAIDLPETKLALKDGSIASGEVLGGYSFDMKTLLDLENVPPTQVRWQAFAPTAGVGSGETAGLPNGVTLNYTTGLLSGTAGSRGTFKFEAVATWSDPNDAPENLEARKVYTLVIDGKVFSFTSISAGRFHTCGGTPSGGVQCWGQGDWYQNGRAVGATSNLLLPTDVPFVSDVVKVSSGDLHTCALLENGDIKCWGRNHAHQLGDGGTTTGAGQAVRVEGLGGPAKDVVAGFSRTCAILETGTLKCWGSNSSGILGNGDQINQPVPVEILPGTRVASVALGNNHACLVTEAGAAMCWGSNSYGEVGTGTKNPTRYLLPQPVRGLASGVKDIAVAANTTCALMQTGAVKCWGNGGYGLFGNGQMTGSSAMPVDVSGLSAVEIGAGENNFCAALSGGGLQCWGSNGNGQNGTGTVGNTLTPKSVVGISGNVRLVDGGNAHTCALLDTGEARCWGYGGEGRLGNGSTTQQNSPVTVGG